MNNVNRETYRVRLLEQVDAGVARASGGSAEEIQPPGEVSSVPTHPARSCGSWSN